jgi:hypothetical protein
MPKLLSAPSDVAGLVAEFMHQMHRYDGGRTLPILYGARLTTAQLAALELARAPRTASKIADSLGLSRPATSQLIAKLARATGSPCRGHSRQTPANHLPDKERTRPR